MKTEGEAGLAVKPNPGRPPKRSKSQASVVLGWLEESPLDFDFSSELRTAKRIAILFEREFGIHCHSRYVSEWLMKRGVSPQKAKIRPIRRDDDVIDAWIRDEWPVIRKRGRLRTPTSS